MSAPTITFGKHRGTSIEEVPTSYLRWMLQAASSSSSGPIYNFCRAHGEWMADVISREQQLKAAEVVFEYELNPSQAEASNLLQNWLADPHAPSTAKLEGGAGYGKSFTVLDIVRGAISQGYTVAAAATSFVATQVLDSQLGNIGIPCRTLASSLKLTVEREGARSDYVWDHGSSDDALGQLTGPRRLLIVDEYSMVGDDIGEKLLMGVQHYGGRLLCVGDLKQLPPVGQSKPSVLAGIETSVTLTQPMRYSPDSDLYALEQDVRHNGFSATLSASDHISIHSTREALLEAYVSSYKAAPTEDQRMLFFRRADVVSANNIIRSKLFGIEAAEEAVIEDEKLLVMATTDVLPMASEETLRMYSGTSYRVISQTTVVVPGTDFECHAVTLEDGRCFPIIFMLSETKADPSKLGGTEWTLALRRIAEECEMTGNWGPYWHFKKRFLPVGYAYAMTVHRCQGQTVDRVFFEAGSLRCGYMSDALLYVAATRAKKEVHAVPLNGLERGGWMNDEEEAA